MKETNNLIQYNFAHCIQFKISIVCIRFDTVQHNCKLIVNWVDLVAGIFNSFSFA